MASKVCIAAVTLSSCLFVMGCGAVDEGEPEGAHEDEPEVVVDCAARSLETCERDEECEHFYGTRLDEERTCWSEVMPAQCKPRDIRGLPAVTHAVSPTGSCWSFGTLFLHEGWHTESSWVEAHDEPYPCPGGAERSTIAPCE
jgi:hypothetical protein